MDYFNIIDEDDQQGEQAMYKSPAELMLGKLEVEICFGLFSISFFFFIFLHFTCFKCFETTAVIADSKIL